MKYCSKCKKYYSDSDIYCLKCNRVLSKIDDESVPDIIKNTIQHHDKIKNNPRSIKTTIIKHYNQENSYCTPRCPICGSTSLSKITNTHKVMKIAMFGIFGIGENGKTWKCNNCGSKF